MTTKKTTKRRTARKRTESNGERFIRVAKLQMRRACIPTAVAVTTSVVISKLGAPIVPIAAIAAGGWAYFRGYRIRIVKPGEDANDE